MLLTCKFILTLNKNYETYLNSSRFIKLIVMCYLLQSAKRLFGFYKHTLRHFLNIISTYFSLNQVLVGLPNSILLSKIALSIEEKR